MSSLRYKSFCLGIIVTSITWAIALYLFTNLTDNSSLSSEKIVFVREQKWNMNFSYKKPKDFKQNTVIDVHNKEGSVWKKNGEWKNSVIHSANDFRDFNYLKLKEVNQIPNMKMTNLTLEQIKRSTLQDNINSHISAVNDLGLVRTEQDRKLREEGYQQHAFNLLVSNRLGYHRDIRDTRHYSCKDLTYERNLPSATIIICFYNEARSTLLRTVHSVLDRTPAEFLHEILLVDDHSDLGDLQAELDEYVTANLPSKVQLLRMTQREGLIRARIFGAKNGKGKVLVFLDSHCEVNYMWLEPLLNQISKSRTNVVCPIIDIINSDTFIYTASPIVRGGFNWGLHFKWDSLPSSALLSKEDFIKPIVSPTMAGGLFAIDSQFFRDLGEYDAGMDIWGGENLELSFRIWMCGGTLEIIPCSRVGHVFRRRRPYGSPTGEDTMVHNSLRVAHVWMDDYKEYFFKLRPDARGQPFGNISERIALRKHLKCKSFDWYLKNVYPELKPPTPKMYKDNMRDSNMKKGLNKSLLKRTWKRRMQKLTAKYLIRLSGSNLCIESESDVTVKGSLVLLRTCQHYKTQLWFETEKNELLLAELLCLDAGEDYPRLAKCHEMGGPQEWNHKSKKNTPIYNMAAGMCLGVKEARDGEYVVMELCTQAEPSYWDLVT